ncbi:muconolactone delta-isomerase [Salinisphaera sp. T5B8]|uniref:muconolactone Delta-isomerase n=1 Tax=Salinisphaera sp. T5B8 TaxID=1304154 RepID=UPI00333FF13C
MLFHVHMRVALPGDMPAETAAELKAREKALAQALQQSGHWRHLWRIAGAYENISIFDVADNSELHELLTQLPLFPYMQIDIRPLCRHPSSIHDGDR